MADGGRTGTAGLVEELARQREALAGRAPAYARALELLPAVLEGAPGRFLAAAWEHRTFHAWYDRPLLLLAALRHDALSQGEAHPLWAAFAATAPRVEAVTPAALEAALAGRRDRLWDALVRRGVKTNDPSRAVAWLWPAALAGAAEGGRPIALADVGASAGLNLVADALPNAWTAEDGRPLEIAGPVHAVARVGLDAEPLDAASDEDVAWLRACVWPGEVRRLDRLEAAVAAFRGSRTRPDAPVLVPISAREVPARLDLLSAAESESLVIAYQTVVRDYLDPGERDDYEAGMRGWVASHRPGLALWVELEAAEPRARLEPGAAALTAHVRAPDGAVRTLLLARCGFHPERVERAPAAVEELRAALAARAAEPVRAGA
jgi:hypothetical protein